MNGTEAAADEVEEDDAKACLLEEASLDLDILLMTNLVSKSNQSVYLICIFQKEEKLLDKIPL